MPSLRSDVVTSLRSVWGAIFGKCHRDNFKIKMPSLRSEGFFKHFVLFIGDRLKRRQFAPYGTL